LKEAGYWLIGLDEGAEKSYTAGRLHIAGGNSAWRRGQGLHELTRKRCDFVVSLPTAVR